MSPPKNQESLNLDCSFIGLSYVVDSLLLLKPNATYLEASAARVVSHSSRLSCSREEAPELMQAMFSNDNWTGQCVAQVAVSL